MKRKRRYSKRCKVKLTTNEKVPIMFKKNGKTYLSILMCLCILIPIITKPFIGTVLAQEEESYAANEEGIAALEEETENAEIPKSDIINTETSEAETSKPEETESKETEPQKTEPQKAESKKTESKKTESEETESEETESEETETETSSEIQMSEEGVLANSWRFTDGVWTPAEIKPRAATNSIAWTKVNGNFMNSNGGIIAGALAKGIDVSEHQGAVNWTNVKASDIEFAIIRCGYGENITSQDDKYWKTNADECRRLGIPFGTYLYSYATTQAMAKNEAEHVLRLVKGYSLDYPIYFDLEDNSLTGLTSAEIAKIAKTFCDTIEAAGYKAAIYANTNWFNTYLTDSTFNQWDKWVAQYNYECTYAGSYSMWQCTSSGTVSGINGPVDLNFLFGQKSPDKPLNTEQVKAFVTRLYKNIHGRNPDSDGLTYWTNVLINRQATGAEVAMKFINSPELQRRGLSDSAFVNVIYNTVLDRSGDSDGIKYWNQILGYGISRNYVASKFLTSNEFRLICNQYGITQGSVNYYENRDKNVTYTRFVARLYEKALKRKFDVDGLNYWTGILLNGTCSYEEVAEKFFMSREMELLGYSNSEYVKVLYRTFLDREPDTGGYNYFLNRLNNGANRLTIMYNFSRGAEFRLLVGQN